MTDSNRIITVNELAYKAIAKHNRRIFKHEAGVLLDNDPEHLHQMRVGIRRLRSAIASFALTLNLPDILTDKSIAKIGHRLGKLRDLDVLLEVLSNSYRSHPRQFLQQGGAYKGWRQPPIAAPGETPQRTVSQLSAKEQKILDRVIKSLEKRRKRELKQVRKTLDSKLYLNLKQELNHWLKRPKYHKILGDLTIDYALPDLLLPQVSQFLIHPGWFVGIELRSGKIKSPKISNPDRIEQLLKSEDTLLHNLRKSAKKTRYSLELFSKFYGNTYHDYLQQVETVQEILGQIQDTYVLRKVVEKTLRAPISEKLPELTSLLLQIRYQRWLEWQELQKQFLKDETRQKFRWTITEGIRTLEHQLLN